jgi:ABC-type sugar transport system ATPase subunit
MPALPYQGHGRTQRDEQPTDRCLHAAIPEYAIDTEKLNLWYGTFQALYDVDLRIREGLITSMIGPSGCGKSTFLRSVNRINERLGYVRIEGSMHVMGQNIYDPGVELVQVRKQVGMVFQRPNPLPISIRDNILFSHRLHAKGGGDVAQGTPDEIVEQSLRTGAAVGQGQGPPQAQGDRTVARRAAEAVHRPPAAGQAEGAADGRAVLGARPQGHRSGRGTALGTARPIHDPDRHPQHGAGAPRQRGVRVHADGQGRRARADRGDVRHPDPQGDGRLHRRALRVATVTPTLS